VIHAADGALTATDSNSITITSPCAADHVLWSTQPVDVAVNANMINLVLFVVARDGTICTDAVGTVTISNQSGTCQNMVIAGTLTGTLSSGQAVGIANVTENFIGQCTLVATSNVSGATGLYPSQPFTVFDPAVISQISPTSGRRGTSVSIVVTGTTTHFVDGVSMCRFYPSSGITVTSTTVSNSTTATCNVTIANGASMTSRTIRITTGSEYANLASAFTVTSGGARLRGR
jgi:hypothetical protein